MVIPSLAPQTGRPVSPRLFVAAPIEPITDRALTPDEVILGSYLQKDWPLAALGSLHETAQRVAATLAPSHLASLAVTVGLQTELQKFKAHAYPPTSSPLQAERFDKAWTVVKSHLGERDLQAVATDAAYFHYAASNDDTIIVKPSDFADDALLAFATAHEAAHCLFEDDQALEPLQRLRRLGEAPREAVRLAYHHCEYRADAWAARVVASMGADIKPVLANLLQTLGGESHPDGLERATELRAQFASLGRPVSESDWQSLLKQAEPERQRLKALEDQEAAFRRNLAKFV